jgi:hypothetical protein
VDTAKILLALAASPQMLKWRRFEEGGMGEDLLDDARQSARQGHLLLVRDIIQPLQYFITHAYSK